ncbi:DUF4328 domain-containing protein [Mycolicibacterium moriokaense]|uniref:Uncharacterized protein DUF4328 n=1 Tax=Mycolicibacterium moriokaense TaxID=39691 RepID=A0A318HNW8_9MYCO|nr:DUF4328 domain-containing protein [Mycolicibacterium moriokaense]PXX13153.1 uncharacterized protein DUF4328 [Mycolicibacterium moriokaense]
MIQVCSACGTRWNVRDRRRVWCPRCNGALLAPSGPPPGAEWGPRPAGSPQGSPPRGRALPPGYRWIAVRPGAAPPPRRGRRPLGPTPRYAVIPRWGLVDHFAAPELQAAPPPRSGPSLGMVRATLISTMVVLGVAALVHVVRYALLIVNRSVLLNKVVALIATWAGVLASVVAVFMVVASAVVLTNWLIARRAAAFAHHRRDDPRPTWALRAGCLVPLVNLFWAPVFVIELAAVEERLNWLRRSIAVWWIVWVFSTAVSGFSIATSFTQDPQGIADNTVTTIVAYLLGLAALLLGMKVFLGFERQPVEQPAKRWVIVRDDQKDEAASAGKQSESEPEPAAAVESQGQNPAA